MINVIDNISYLTEPSGSLINNEIKHAFKLFKEEILNLELDSDGDVDVVLDMSIDRVYGAFTNIPKIRYTKCPEIPVLGERLDEVTCVFSSVFSKHSAQLDKIIIPASIFKSV